MFTLGILTISDAGSRGEREDTSGRIIREMLAPPEYELRRQDIVPDEVDIIAGRLTRWADQDGLDLIVTTGGTGLTDRDVTPEATLSVIQRQVPGIAEAMRLQTLKYTPMAMLSRAVAGTRGRTLIINLPGSPKGVRQCLEVVVPVLPHAIQLIKGQFTTHTPSS